MKSSFKGKGHNYTCTVEIDITPENQKQKNSSSAKQTIKSGLFHKKINSVNNRYSKMKENINLNCTSESTTQSKNSLNTPEIGVQYKLRLEKLNTNILNLKNKYKDLIKENFETNNKIDTFKMRFLQLKKIEDGKKMNKNKEKYLIVKNAKNREELEKNQKLRDECRENKKKEFQEKKKEVQKLKFQEINDLKNHQMKIKMNQMNKKRIKEEEKQYIEEELNEQKNKNLKEIEKRKIMKKEKERKKEERILGNQVYALKQIEKDLKSKIKIQNSINNKMNKQYFHYIQDIVNDEDVKISYLTKNF